MDTSRRRGRTGQCKSFHRSDPVRKFVQAPPDNRRRSHSCCKMRASGKRCARRPAVHTRSVCRVQFQRSGHSPLAVARRAPRRRCRTEWPVRCCTRSRPGTRHPVGIRRYSTRRDHPLRLPGRRIRRSRRTARGRPDKRCSTDREWQDPRRCSRSLRAWLRSAPAGGNRNGNDTAAGTAPPRSGSRREHRTRRHRYTQRSGPAACCTRRHYQRLRCT